MKLNDYQQEAYSYAEYDSSMYPYLGLAEEVGEVMQMAAKTARGDDMLLRYGSFEAMDKVLLKELGDVLWMVSAILTDHQLTLEDCARTNLDKLSIRKTVGNIKGDNRGGSNG